MKPDSVFGGAPEGAPGVSTQVLHTIRPQIGWVGIAILSILVLQAFLTLLVVLRQDGSGRNEVSQPQAVQAAAEREEDAQRPLPAPEERLGRELDFRRRKERLDVERTLFDQLLGKVKVGPDGKLDLRELVEENQSQHKEIERLSKLDFLLDELTERLNQVRRESARQVAKLEEGNAELSRRNEQLREQLGKVTQSRDEARADAWAAKAEIERLKSPPTEIDGEQTAELEASPDVTDESASGGPQGEDGISVWTIVITLGAALVVVAAGAMIVVIIKRKGNSSHREAENASEDNHR